MGLKIVKAVRGRELGQTISCNGSRYLDKAAVAGTINSCPLVWQHTMPCFSSSTQRIPFLRFGQASPAQTVRSVSIGGKDQICWQARGVQ